MKVRKTVTGIVLSLLVVVAVFSSVVVMKGADIVMSFIEEYVKQFNSRNPSFSVTYERIEQLRAGGLEIQSLEIADSEDVFFRASEIKISSSFAQLFSMVFGKTPRAIQVEVSGASFKGTDGLLNKFSTSEKNSKSSSGFSFPFEVEFTVNSMTAEIDMVGLKGSVGKLNIHGAIGKKGLHDTEVTLPFVSLSTPVGDFSLGELAFQATDMETFTASLKSFSWGDRVNAENLNVSAEILNNEITATALFDSIEGYEGKLFNTEITATYSEGNVSAEIFSQEGTLSVVNFPIQKVETQDLQATASWSKKEGLLATSNAGLRVNSSLEFLPEASCKANFYAKIPNLEKVFDNSILYAELQDISCPLFSTCNQLNLSVIDGETISCEGFLSDGLSVDCAYWVSSKQLRSSVVFENTKIDDFKKIVTEYIPFAESYLMKDSSISGRIMLNAEFNSKIPQGRAEVSLKADNLDIPAQPNSVGFNLIVSTEESIMGVELFEVTAFDYSAEFSGSVNIDKLTPQGLFVLNNVKTGNEVAKARCISYLDSFDVIVTIDQFTDLEIDTKFRFLEFGKFDADSTIITKYAVYPVVISVDSTSDISVLLESEGNKLNLSFSHDGILSLTSYFEGFLLSIDNQRTINVSGSGSGNINTSTLAIAFDFKNLGLGYSDDVQLFCNLHIDNKELKMSAMRLRIKGAGAEINGSVELGYHELTNLASLDFEGILGLQKDALKSLTEGDIKVRSVLSTQKGDSLSLLYEDDVLLVDLNSSLFETPLVLKLLGTPNDGYFGSVKLKEISSELSYVDGIISFSHGKLDSESIDIEDFSLLYDRNTGKLTGNVNLVYVMRNHTGDISCSADIEVNALVSKFGDFLKGEIFSGAVYDLNLSISNASIGSQFEFPDTDLFLKHNAYGYTITGNMINGFFRSSDNYVSVTINPDFSVGMSIEGCFGEDVDLVVKNIVLPIQMINPFLNIPVVDFRGGVFTGDLLVHGKKDDMMFYGMLYCSAFELGVFYVPDQTITVKNIVISVNEHTISMPLCPFVGYSDKTSRIFSGNTSLEAVFQNTKFESFEVSCELGDTPFDFWLPLSMAPGKVLNLRGDVSNGGGVITVDSTGKIYITVDVLAQDFYGDFDTPVLPDWFWNGSSAPILDITARTGKNVEFYYPNQLDPFVNLTVAEGEKVRIRTDAFGKLSSEGNLAVRTGRIYYFNNDFYVDEGHIYFEENKILGNGLQMLVDLTAKTRQYDSNGDPLDIYLNVNKANIENLSMRFSSTSGLTENEIIQILGQAVLPTQDGISLASFASFAYAASQAVQKLNLIDSNASFSLSSTLKEALGLDFLSARTPLLANILVDALPGMDSDVSLIAKYLNGTSVFAGKYFSEDLFARVSLLLESDGSGKRNNRGNFLSKDLIINTEVSLEWDTPVATWNFFMNPTELSVFSFLDTIGLTVSKSIRY